MKDISTQRAQSNGDFKNFTTINKLPFTSNHQWNLLRDAMKYKIIRDDQWNVGIS